jgi:hypothetical protein
MEPELQVRTSGGGVVHQVQPGRWRLEIPAGEGGSYRWAQLDDYMPLPRSRFPWRAPLRFSLRARVSADGLPGTWGFGLWNNPFSASFGVSGMAARLPALPNAAWFFYAGPPNHLAFRDDHPAQGFLAATFASPRIPSLLLAPAGLALPLLALRPAARLARRLAARIIGESAALVPGGPTAWRSYTLELTGERTVFTVDGAPIFTAPHCPPGPLGLVLWIDNQYAAFPPNGQIRAGTSPSPTPAWLEMEEISIQ